MILFPHYNKKPDKRQIINQIELLLSYSITKNDIRSQDTGYRKKSEQRSQEPEAIRKQPPAASLRQSAAKAARFHSLAASERVTRKSCQSSTFSQSGSFEASGRQPAADNQPPQHKSRQSAVNKQIHTAGQPLFPKCMGNEAEAVNSSVSALMM
jgi:hypothetical protein